ncbi:S9 family peptidase [Saccharobesus litoralis]|uniref:S9 family peptidase n=1 Tax=Saccharobesus litoralis TaxID=2172099 RepID=A0A2S0VYB3_9ALTE|nr:S9 family peptidase [Saccharobesus litoralis]
MSNTVTFPRLPALNSQAPKALQRNYTNTYHGFELSDPFHWLKDPSYPKVDDKDVIAYLEQENDYFAQFIEPQQPLVERLYQEFKGREQPQETSVPWVKNGYEYRWYFPEGKEYKVWLRKPLAGGDEVVILDENIQAQGKKFYSVASVSVSPDNQYLAWSFDDDGSERFSIRVKNLLSGELQADKIEQTSGELVWSADSQQFLYTLVSDEWRPYLVKAHTLGQADATDVSIYEEKDSGFFIHLGKTSSGQYVLIATGSHTFGEVYTLPSGDFAAKPQLLAGRDIKMEYDVDHAHGQFFIRSNDQHKNFRVATVADLAPTYDNWRTLIAGSDSHYITGVTAFAEQLVIEEKVNGLEQIRLRAYDGAEYTIEFPEAVYSAGLGNNPEFSQPHLRISYESMVSPHTVYDYQLASKKLLLRKQQDIPSGYDASQYQTERLWATARDGMKVPISIVYKKGFKQDGSQPMHLYAYGAYGMGMTPEFSKVNLSLLDRGFSYAIAHVRGGDELGYQWYLDGKLDKRSNTFNDFIDVAEFLIKQGYVSQGNISISGRSAGGELMGAVTVQRPDLWRSVILGVPFVDVLNTMLDDSLPLTPIEWPEWGNPITSKADYATIASYSPYDNIAKVAYPPMMVTGGINDPRVTYWEPAKWTAKMRAYKTDNNLLVMRMHMGAGHFSSSGRYARLKDDAQEFAFMLLAHGIHD